MFHYILAFHKLPSHILIILSLTGFLSISCSFIAIPSVLAQAAIMDYHTGWLKQQTFLMDLQARSPRLGCQLGQVLGKVPVLDAETATLLLSSSILWGFSLKSPNLIMRTPPLHCP